MLFAFVNSLLNLHVPSLYYLPVGIIQSFSYLIPFIYLGLILNFLNEQRSIIIAFIINGCYFLNTIIMSYTVDPRSHQVIYVISGGIAFIIVINLSIQIFRIKNRQMGLLFRIYCVTMLLRVCVRVSGPFFIPVFQNKDNIRFLVIMLGRLYAFFDLFPSVIIVVILYKTLTYLSAEQLLIKHAALSADQPA